MANTKNHQNSIRTTCPECGQPLLPNAHFCYECGHFLTKNRSHVLPPESVNDADILALLNESDEEEERLNATPRGKISSVLFILLCISVVSSGVSFLWGPPVLTIFCVITAVVSLILTIIVTPKQTESVLHSYDMDLIAERYVIPPIVTKVFGQEVTYDAEQKLPEAVLKEYMDGGYDVFWSTQHIQGNHHGLAIEAGYVSEKNLGESNNKDAFDGYCLYTKTALRPEADLVLTALGCDFDGKEDFDYSYDVDCDLPEVGDAILTPAVKTAFCKLAAKGDYAFTVTLRTNGALFIAYDSFIYGVEDKETLQSYRRNSHRDLTVLLRILDAFLQNPDTVK